MLLATELKAYRVAESPDNFKKVLITTLFSEFPGRSIDSVLCRPSDALDYCKMVRKAIASDPPDIVILKTLVNIRRGKSCPTGLKSNSERKFLRTRLREIGCTIEEHAFRELVNDCLASMYHNQTIDEVLCHPCEARALCQYVRNRRGCDVLTEELILGTLLNNRKSPR